MKKIDLLPWLTVFIILSPAIKSVDSDEISTPSTSVLCPNSPVTPIYPSQPTTINSVDADDILPPTTTSSTHVLCPNSPVTPIYPSQPTTPPTTQPTTLSSTPSFIPPPCPPCPPCPTCSICTPLCSSNFVTTTCPPCLTSNLPCQNPPCTTSQTYLTSCPTFSLPPTTTSCFSFPYPPCRTITPTPCPSPHIPITPTCPPYIPPPPTSTIPSSTSPIPNFLTTSTTPSFTSPIPPFLNPSDSPTILPSTSSPPTTEQTTHPPMQIVKCPTGTVIVNGVCRLIYCGTQSIYREGKCLQVECPEGTYWNGWKCSITSEPTVNTITFNTTLITHVNSLSPPIVVNNFNNITVNSTSTIDSSAAISSTCEECQNEPEETSEKLNCCTVVTPRICKPKIEDERKKWDCYSKRYRRCGDICVAPTVYLRAPYPSKNGAVTVLPPDNYLSECRRSKTCVESTDIYDCSGCVAGRPENCSSYCYRYVCPSRRCKFYSQVNFCEQYPGEQGCLEEDGCFADWCDGNARKFNEGHYFYDE